MNPLDPLDAAMMTAELVSNPMHVGAVLILSPPGRRRARTTSTNCIARRSPATIRSIRGCADIRIAVSIPAACGSGVTWTPLT